MTPSDGIVLPPQLIELFAGGFLSDMYDDPAPTPPFHRECWALYCSDHPLVAVAAPRFHAKSTALTHAFILAFTNRGKMHWIKVYDLPQLGPATRGKAIVNLLNRGPNERMVAMAATKQGSLSASPTGDEIRKSLAPEYQIGLYGGIRF